MAIQTKRPPIKETIGAQYICFNKMSADGEWTNQFEEEVEKTETEKNPQDDHLSSSTESSSSDTGKEKETETVSRVKEYSISNELIAAAVEDFFGEERISI